VASGHPSCKLTDLSGTTEKSRRFEEWSPMIRKLASGQYRLYSRTRDPKTGRRKNLGTFRTREAAQRHERAIQYFKRQK
jgi:hypothetical protein